MPPADAHQADEDRLAEHLMRAIDETTRVEQLTTVQLVDELLGALPFTEYDELLEEACTRLDPTWQQRHADTPLDDDNRAMLARAWERFEKRLAEVRARTEATRG